MSKPEFQEQLKERGLKVTPQRMIIYEAVVSLQNHPTADNIISYVKQHYPGISVGTVYKE